jgi:carbon monoxide dehydrogenase subunit G
MSKTWTTSYPAGPRRIAAAIAVGLALMVCATPLAASTPEADPIVTVTSGDNLTAVIHGQVDVSAPRATVWRLLVDCDKSVRIMVGAKSCKVLQRDPAGRWDMREQVSKGGGLSPTVKIIIRSQYDAPHTVHFHRTQGDVKTLDGDWRLEPLDAGHTRVFYDSELLVAGAPGPLARTVLRRDIPRNLSNLRDASEADAAGA